MFEASKRVASKFLSGFVYLDSLLMDSFDLQSDSFESVSSKTRKLFVWNVPLAMMTSLGLKAILNLLHGKPVSDLLVNTFKKKK